MKRNIPQTTMFIFIALAAISLALWAFFLFLVFSNSGEVSGLIVDTENRFSEEKALSSARTLATDISDKTAELDSIFVKEESVADFVEYIEGEAESSGANVLISTLKLDEEDAPIKKLSARIEAEGPWFSVIEFVARMEKSPRVVFIDRLALTSVADSSGSRVGWRASFEVITSVIK